MPVYSIEHTTTYRYGEPVSLSHQVAHLEPLTSESQECLHFALEVWPRPLELAVRTDYFGNRIHYFTLTEPHRQLHLAATSKVTVTPLAVPLNRPTATVGQTATWLRDSADAAAHQARQYLYPSPYAAITPTVADMARNLLPPGRPIVDGVMEMCAKINRQFVFDPTATTPATTVGEFFQLGRGVCQDFAHLAVVALRSAGLAARYVSGYLLTQPPPGQRRLVGTDASHAWVGVYVPGVGWLDFDPTNDCLCGDRHISVARGRDFGDVSPVRGTVTGGGRHTLSLGVTVSPAGP